MKKYITSIYDIPIYSEHENFNLTTEILDSNDFWALIDKVQRLNSEEGTKHKYYDCPKCKNKGYSYIVEFDYFFDEPTIKQVDCNCKAIRNNINSALQSGFRRYFEQDWKDFQTTALYTGLLKERVQEHVRKTINGEKHSLFIGGKTGTGKTMLVSLEAKELLSNGIEVMLINWDSFVSEYFSQLNNNYKTKEDTAEKMKQECIKAPVLVMDDILRKNNNESFLKLFYEIVNLRYQNNKITLFTSEKTIDEIQKIDSALSGRIREMCSKPYCLNLPNNMKDYRNDI